MWRNQGHTRGRLVVCSACSSLRDLMGNPWQDKLYSWHCGQSVWTRKAIGEGRISIGNGPSKRIARQNSHSASELGSCECSKFWSGVRASRWWKSCQRLASSSPTARPGHLQAFHIGPPPTQRIHCDKRVVGFLTRFGSA